MKIEQLYKDFNIDYAPEGSRNVGGGWIGVHCPFCAGGKDYHLGFNLESNRFSCWRCGWHPIKETLIKLLNVDEKTARQLIRQYKGHDGKARVRLHRDKKPFKYPGTTGPLLPAHKQYLADRGFDPGRLEYEWGLLGTGPVSRLGESDYRLRILAPIMWGGEVVTFQARDITDRQSAKYKACPQEYEKIHHKHILYGKQEAWKSTGIVVEGITDVWRFGPVAAATFGIKYTTKQLRIIAKTFKRVFIVFDPDPQAQQQALHLTAELKDFPKYQPPDVIMIEQDPGSMSQENADYLIKQLLK